LPNQPYAPTDLLGRWIGPGIKQNDDDHVDSKIDYSVAGGNLSVTFSGGHPFQVQAPLQPLNPQFTTSSSRRISANYVIGRPTWTSSTRFGRNRNYAERIEKYWFMRDPNKAETLPASRMIPAISYPGMTGLNRENKTWGLIPAYSFEQQLALFRGAHSLKFGGIISLPGGGEPDTTAAQVTYQTLQDVMLNEPATIAFQANKPPFKWRMKNFGLFAQDDWRVSRKLVLNLGVRYDRYGHFVARPWDGEPLPESHPEKAQERWGGFVAKPLNWPPGTPASLVNLDGLIDPQNFVWGPLRDPKNPFNSDNLSIAPRLGFAYTMNSQGDFVMRGGFGVNFTGFDPSTYEEYVQTSPKLPRDRTYTRAEAAARGLKFPVYIEDLSNLAQSESGDRPQAGSRWNPNMRPPYAMNYTLGFQRALTSTTVLETAFVGTRGVKFNLVRTYNQIDRITGIRPNPNDIQGNYTDNSQQTNYNSWQTSLKQRMTHGLLFNLHYTWGKAMSYTGGDISPGFIGDTRGSIEDFQNVRIERSPSTGDITHSVIVDWVYEAPTPFPNFTATRHVLGGWQISGIWKTQSGLPLIVTQTGGRPDILDIKSAVNTTCCSFGNVQYLNPAAFQLVDVGRASNRTIRRGFAGAAPLRAPGITNVDISLGKTFPLSERKRLELKADMLNAFNHTQYTSIDTNLSGIQFGRAIGTASARVIQLELRLAF